MLRFLTRDACPQCGATAPSAFLIEIAFDDPTMQQYLNQYYGGRVPALDGVYSLVQCPTCGGLYQLHILDDAGMDALYEDWIAAKASFLKKDKASLTVRTGYARQVRQFIHAVNLPPHQINLLDFGMGWGTWLMMARGFGLQVMGLEVSPSRVAYAEKNGLPTTSHETITAEQFHAINAEQVFEHLANPRIVMQSCFNWLKPKGVLRVAVPNGAGIVQQIQQGKWTISKMETIPLEHINTFTPFSLRRMASDMGFVEIAPPFVLPSVSTQLTDWRQAVGVAGKLTLNRFGMAQDTVVWLQKP